VPTFRGERNVEDRSNGPVRGYYNRLQDMLRHPELTGDDRRRVEAQKDLTLRVLFYDSNVRHKFKETFVGAINTGYRSLNMDPPDFASLSRADALASITAFREKMAERDVVPREAGNLLPKLNGLYNLDMSIPSRWI